MKRTVLTCAVLALSGVAAQAADRETATALVAAIAAGSTTAVAEVQAALDALDAHADLNGVANGNARAALAQAAAVDAGTVTGPLAGLPIVVKDNIRVAGLPNAAGTPGLQSAIAEADAPVVARLVAAGAIVVATSNMHELAFGISGWNPTYQTGAEPGVRNPYDTTKFAGGSSSGTGALVGAGVVPAGLGTDTGGSVRVPSAVNGVSGLRPSLGRYPADGIVPISHSRDTAGVIAASVADIALMDGVIAGDSDPVAPADLAGVSLGVGAMLTGGLDADTQARFDATLDLLRDAGARIVDVNDAEIFALNGQISFPIALTEARGDLEAYLADWMPGISIQDMAAQIASPDVKATYLGLVLPGKLPAPDGTLVDGQPIYEAAMKTGRPALIAAYEAIFSEAGIDALIFPTTPGVAVDQRPEASDLATFGAFIRNTDPGSNAGLPGLSLAGGLGPDSGLPVGIELDGPVGSDRALLSIGLAIEALLGLTPLPMAR